MSGQLRQGIELAVAALAEGKGATIDAVASQDALMSLDCVTSVVDGDRGSIVEAVAGAAALMLEEAADSLDEHPSGSSVPNRAKAARAALGVYPGTQGRLLRGRRGSPGRLPVIARWLAYEPDSLFRTRQDGRSPFGALVDDVSEYVVRREIAHRVTERRLANQARRPPLESAMRVDWLPRFERYYIIWSYIIGVRYDLGLALSYSREGDSAETDYFTRKSLWYYACFVNELEKFTQELGGLWIMPNPKAEQIIADAVWMLREPSPLNELDESILRISLNGLTEMALFVQATHTDQALRRIYDGWLAWIASCKCAKPKKPRKDCSLHQCIHWCASFVDNLNEQWDSLADWYDVPRPESVVVPSGK